jgi:hypothetical protein
MADMEAIAASLNLLLANYGGTRDEIADLLGGPADGGPAGDGNYPVTLANGNTRLVPSPARIALLTGDPATAVAALQPILDATKTEATRATDAVGQALAAVVTAQAAADLVAVTVANPPGPSAQALSLRNKLGFEIARVGVDGSVSTSAWALGPSPQPGFTITNGLGFVLFDQASGSAATGAGAVSVGAVTTASVAPIIGDEIFLVSDRPLPLYPRAILTTRGDADTALVSIASRIGLPSRPFVATSNQAAIALDPAIMGATADLIVRPIGSPSSRLYKSLTVNKKTVPVVAGSQSPKVMLFGDSITNFQTGHFVRTLLESWGLTPAWIGTMNGTATLDSNNTAGPLGEGRSGWSLWGDFLGHAPNADDNDVSGGVVAVGAEAGYLSSSKEVKRTKQPFLRPTQAGDVAARIVTIGGVQYTFDLRFYLDRFGLADPDIVVVNCGKNDENENPAAASIANVAAGYPILLDAIRQALPAARILLWATTSPRHLRAPGQDTLGAFADDSWDGQWAPILASIVTMVRARRVTDPLLHLCSVWAHQSQEVGWSMKLGAADSMGVQSALISDTIHPLTVAREQHCEALAAAIANLV